MRKTLLALAVAAVLAVPTAATAAAQPGPTPGVACGTGCLGGGSGFTGCANVRVDHKASVSVAASIDHFLVVHYCKVGGVITSVSISAHGCDTGGVVACSTGAAWQTGGGVGSRSASFEAHATWHLTALAFYNGTDVLTLTVPSG